MDSKLIIRICMFILMTSFVSAYNAIPDDYIARYTFDNTTADYTGNFAGVLNNPFSYPISGISDYEYDLKIYRTPYINKFLTGNYLFGISPFKFPPVEACFTYVCSLGDTNCNIICNETLLNLSTFPKALSFNFTNYVSTNLRPQRHFNNSFTISSWFKLNSSSDLEAIAGTQEGVYQFILYKNNADEIRFNMGVVGYGTGETVNGKWQHVAVSYNASGNAKIRLYMDGVEVHNQTVTPFILPNYNISIGARNRGSYNDLNSSAVVDELIYYNRGLSEEEVLSLYNGYNASVLVTIKGIIDNQLITENTTIEFINETGRTTYSTLTGEKVINGLYGFYDIVANAEGYQTAYNQINITQHTAYNLPIFLVNTTTYASTTFTMRETDTDNVMEDVTLTIQNMVNSEYTTVAVYSSDVTGRVAFDYIENSRYKFIVSKEGYITKEFILDPIIFNSYNVRLEKSSLEDSDFYLNKVAVAYNPKELINNEVNNFNISFFASDGSLTLYSAEISFNGTSNSTFGTVAYGEILPLSINISNAFIGDFGLIHLEYERNGVNYTFDYNLEILNPNSSKYTWATMKDQNFNMNIIEKIILMLSILIAIAGAVTYFAGSLAGALTAEFLFGFFIKIQFFGSVTVWVLSIPMIILFTYIVARSKQ